MSKVKRFSLEERYGYQNRKVIYDKKSDNDIELNNIYPIIDLLNQLDAKVEQERKRIDVLCRDIECKFNRYFTELKAQCSTIVSDVPTLKVNRYEENAPIHPAIAEFGEIEVEPLKLRFVRGYKE